MKSILDEKGLVNEAKLKPISFNAVHNAYLKTGEKVGNAFFD